MDKEVTGSRQVFLKGNDELANEINANANRLYQLLTRFDVSSVTIADEFKDYFVNHHLGKRLFFSLQNSAHIIYQSVKMASTPVKDISFIDYGAGLGTLYMLAGMMNFKRTVYNDYLPDWQHTARLICEALRININEYVTGDVDAVMLHAKENNIQYQIVASRNVIEHIYSLPDFYQAVYKHNPKAIVFSTTTANYHNPAMRLYHVYIHYKAEKTYYRRQRQEQIKKLHPLLPEDTIKKLVALTRGKAKKDFTDAVNNFMNNQPVTKDSSLRTNTCDCNYGLWIEHLLTRKEHEQLAAGAGFKISYTAGYWDTHYRSTTMNLTAVFFNYLISWLGEKKGAFLSPFVNIVAYS
jgi:2-polyprenyl-3-methyl-5-hydroxy-6-metoxy-1,4-benzoquinol methylase